MKTEPDAPQQLGLRELWAELDSLPHYSHWGLLQQALYHLFRSARASPLTSVISVISVALSLVLCAVFLYIFQNVQSAMYSAQSNLEFSVYLRDATPTDAVQKLIGEITARPEVVQATYRSKEEALTALKTSLGADTLLLSGLEKENPLPASIEVRFAESTELPSILERFDKAYSKAAVVERVMYGKGALGNLSMLLDTLRWVGGAGFLLVAMVSAFMVACTIRLGLYAHRDEIEIMQLVGARAAFIRLPYLIEGVVQGALGAALAIAFAAVFHRGALYFCRTSDFLSMSFPALEFLSGFSIALLLIIGTAIGLLGSLFSVRGYLRDS